MNIKFNLQVYPWATAFSKVVAYYFIEDAQPPNWYCEFKEKFVLGPVLCIIFLALFPVGITGAIDISY